LLLEAMAATKRGRLAEPQCVGHLPHPVPLDEHALEQREVDLSEALLQRGPQALERVAVEHLALEGIITEQRDQRIGELDGGVAVDPSAGESASGRERPHAQVVAEGPTRRVVAPQAPAAVGDEAGPDLADEILELGL